MFRGGGRGGENQKHAPIDRRGRRCGRNNDRIQARVNNAAITLHFITRQICEQKLLKLGILVYLNV